MPAGLGATPERPGSSSNWPAGYCRGLSSKPAPPKTSGLSPDYRAEACLDQILQRLNKFPGHGWAAIEVGLTCRVTRNRNLAISALGEWPRDTWPEGAQGALRRLLFQEPDDKARQRVKDLLGQAADEQSK